MSEAGRILSTVVVNIRAAVDKDADVPDTIEDWDKSGLERAFDDLRDELELLARSKVIEAKVLKGLGCTVDVE